MSGKIEVKARKAESLDKRYDYYPEWFIEVTDENDETKKVVLSPSWNQIKDFIRDVKVHELRVDKTRERRNDADNWQREIENASKESQTQLNDFVIPDIYLNQKLKK